MRSIRLYVFKVTLSASLEDLQFENPFAKGLRQKFKEHHAEGVLQFATLLTLFMIWKNKQRRRKMLLTQVLYLPKINRLYL